MILSTRSAIVTLSLLCSVPSLATFEIRDPAAEMYAEQPATEGPGARTCFDFLLDSAKHPDVYQDTLDWARGAVGPGADDRPSGSLEAVLRKLCIDNPKLTLQQAATAIARSTD